jgi:hypothetical protein
MKYLFTLLLLLLTNFSLAEGHIEVATEDQGGIRWLDIYGEDIPASYGMELEVFYSNDDLSIVDTNPKQSGPQIQKGDFFSESAYEISNNVDVRSGRIRYAISLLKPADPVFGSGHLARIGFTSNSNKAVNIELANIKFGTQAGKVLEVNYPKQILIEPALSIAKATASNGFKPIERKLGQQAQSVKLSGHAEADNMLVIGLLSLIGLLLLIVVFLLARRQPIQAN